MLFNSLEFIIFYLPLVLFLFFALSKYSSQWARIFLVGASAFFVGWKNPSFFYLIFFSICINYLIFKLLTRTTSKSKKHLFFILGTAFNVIYLFYFKYFNFSISTLNFFFDLRLETKDILLPLAISFYTFQQISFLHDALNERVENMTFLNFSLFILFFPQLIAGPIIRHHELVPVFTEDRFYRPNFSNLSLGISLFCFGLFKKVVFADSTGKIVDAFYGSAMAGQTLYFFETWVGIMAFSFQLYFDFSGYSDMAVGLGRLFNIKFPQNFNSPYKATSIIDFWRRWHISLSSFLRDNLYIPMGGGRKGRIRKVCNLMITMLLGGLWHGASWTFVLWGGLHGLFLTINHLLPQKNRICPPVVRYIKQFLVFLIVSLTWVFFRAETFPSAIAIYKGALGLNGMAIGEAGWTSFIAELPFHLLFTFSLLLIVLFFPNTYDWHFKYGPSLDYQFSTITSKKLFSRYSWRPNTIWALVILILLFYSFGFINNEQEFIYFQF